MTSEERAAAEELLGEVTKALEAFEATKENAPDETWNRLYRMSIDLRRKLSEDATDRRPLSKPMDSLPLENSESPAANAIQDPHPSSLRENHLSDFTLGPIARLLVCGVCILAWLIPPSPTDPAGSLSLLMFLRFVPIFVVGGSLCERARKGTIIGLGLFFVLMAADSLSFPMRDIYTIDPESFRSVRHLINLANLLCLFGLVGLLLCGAATISLRRGNHHGYRRYLRLTLQAVVAVQLAFVIELGYTSVNHFTGGAHNKSGRMATQKVSHYKPVRSR